MFSLPVHPFLACGTARLLHGKLSLTGTQGLAARVGDCVYGQATGSLGAMVHVDARMVCPCPPALADTEAAAVPTVFLTALACLQLATHMQPGTRVLVHAATGVAVALLLGALLSWACQVTST